MASHFQVIWVAFMVLAIAASSWGLPAENDNKEDKSGEIERQWSSACPSAWPVAPGALSSTSGRFGISNRHTNYSHNQDCSWTITVSGSFIIDLEFRYLDIEYDDNCEYDSVQIIDAGSNKNLSELLCGYDQKVPSIRSDSNSVTVNFISDGSYTGTGFRIKYKAVIASFTPQTGIIEVGSPTRHYSNNVNREFLIYVDSGKNLTLQWIAMAIEGPTPLCPNDYVQVLDGITAAALSNKLCGFTVPADMTIHANIVKVIFHSDATTNYRGLRIRWYMFP